MKSVLIGSAVYDNKYNDIDIIADHDFVKLISKHCDLTNRAKSSSGDVKFFKIDDLVIEITIPNPDTAYELLLNNANLHNGKVNLFGIHIAKTSLSALAALKKAHLILPHHWYKHISSYKVIKDLLLLDEFKPAEPSVKLLFKLHRRECKALSKAHPKLNVKKSTFFEEAEFKIFDHDTIHKAVAIKEVPAYTLMQDGEIWCSKAKWDSLTFDDKFNCLIEEASVLALERSVIPALWLNKPFNGHYWPYDIALFKICTTITSGWFRDFAIEHYQKALDKMPDYVSKFFAGLRLGKIKILKPELVLGE